MPTFHYKANLMINDYFIIRERKHFWQLADFTHSPWRLAVYGQNHREETQREPTSPARQAIIIILMGLVGQQSLKKIICHVK